MTTISHDLEQDCSNPNALAKECLQSCAKPSICYLEWSSRNVTFVGCISDWLKITLIIKCYLSNNTPYSSGENVPEMKICPYKYEPFMLWCDVYFCLQLHMNYNNSLFLVFLIIDLFPSLQAEYLISDMNRIVRKDLYYWIYFPVSVHPSLFCACLLNMYMFDTWCFGFLPDILVRLSV